MAIQGPAGKSDALECSRGEVGNDKLDQLAGKLIKLGQVSTSF